MTKKDFEAFAEAFRASRLTGEGERRQWEFTRHWVAQVLSDSNPRFDWDRFIAATEEATS